MKFLCSPELGRLAKWLRAVGYDATFMTEAIEIPQLLALATVEDRTILTRLKKLRGHQGTPVIYIVSDRVENQIKEVKRSLRIRFSEGHLFTRCIVCNMPVKFIPKAKVRYKVPPYVFETQKCFSTCPSCKRVYWAATHYERAKHFVGLS